MGLKYLSNVVILFKTFFYLKLNFILETDLLFNKPGRNLQKTFGNSESSYFPCYLCFILLMFKNFLALDVLISCY